MRQVKVLLNLSTINKGGALQVAISTLQDSLRDTGSEIQWCYAISKPVAEQIDISLREVQIFDQSPARNSSARKRLKTLAREKQVDAVFTLFGPAYVKFDTPHVCGVADGWVTHSDARAFKSISGIKQKLKMLLQVLYKAYWYRQANYWIVEAAIAKQGLMNRLKIDEKLIAIVPNAISSSFYNQLPEKIHRCCPTAFKILILGAAYDHKNYQILPAVIKQLADKAEFQFKFTLTLPHDAPLWLKLLKDLKIKGLESYVENIGAQPLSNLIRIYEAHDILFFPTLLETFSVTPLEALFCGLPLVISDIPANCEIAGDCAVYFDPENPREAAKSLSYMMYHYEDFITKQAVANRQSRASAYKNSPERYLAYKKILLEKLVLCPVN